MNDYQTSYSRMSDDELLNLARDAASLTAEAQVALGVEMANRRFGAQEVKQQALEIGDSNAQGRSLSQTFEGCGVCMYGKRDFGLDGSFVATRWVVLFYVPIFPFRSYRVQEVGPGFPVRRRQQYSILGEFKPDWRQVTYVYSFVIGFLMGVYAAAWSSIPEVILWSALIVWVMLPWFLRRMARQKLDQSADMSDLRPG